MARVSADVRRQELVEAAIRVMARDGVAKATTRAIVSEAGMQLGFFHYCFRSKQELLLQVIEIINDRNMRAVLEHIKPRGDLRETLTASVGAYWANVEENPGEHQVTYELTQYALRSPGLAAVARKQYENYLASSTEFLVAIAEAAEHKWTVPLPVLARQVQIMIDGATLAWIVDRDSDATRAVFDRVCEQLVASARPRGPARKR